MVLGFEVNWGKIVQGAVSALAIVKAFDEFKDVLAGLGAGGELAAVNQFEFEGAPEAFHGGVVVAVAFAAHGGHAARLGQRVPVVGAGVLNAAIGMEQQLRRRLEVTYESRH